MRYILLKNTSFTDSCMAVWRPGCAQYFAWQLGIPVSHLLKNLMKAPLIVKHEHLGRVYNLSENNGKV